MQSFKVIQIGSKLHISFNQPSKTINQLYVKNEFDSISYKPLDEYTFEIDLKEVLQKFKGFKSNKVYLIVEESDNILTTQRNLKVQFSHPSVHDLHGISDEDTTIHPYITKKGFLHFTISDTLPRHTYLLRRHIDKLSFNNQEAMIQGKFALYNSTLQKANIVIATRFTERFSEFYLPVSKIAENPKQRTTTFSFDIDIYQELVDFMRFPFDQEDVLDVFIEVKIQESSEPIKFKIGNPRILAERFLKGEIITRFNDEIISVVPYLTMKGRNLSFRINRYTLESYRSYINVLKEGVHHNATKEDVWVIGEKSYKAQDNGYHFFKYMRTHHPEIPAYYIIDKDSNEVDNVLPYGNVIFYRSPEHFEIMLKASYICSTHHPELLYPTNSHVYTRKIKATKVFLQHGVLGTKNLTQINGNQLQDFNVDLFVTSSEREKEIVVRDLKFDAHQVLVTGLARFDSLFDNNIQTRDQILIIPTWRDWLTNIESVQESEYRERIETLLNSPYLKTLHDMGNQILFCLHPNMQPFIDVFNVPNHVHTMRQGDIDVQHLIKESKLMITDYSSVAFDFSFLEKPVIYYQFDKERFLGKDPSHLDLEAELPGVIVNNLQSLETTLKYFESRNYQLDHNLINRSKRFLQFKDQHNSQRIYNAVLDAHNNKFKLSNLKNDVLVQHVFKRFRKNKQYFKVMDKVNSLMTKTIPVKKDLIVFESNVGKSVGDSPKVIYDALKSTNHNFEIVWVNNTQYPFNDSKVKSVKRLSPEYFYYLSRAKFWVNNQNFPYYISKAQETTYIQTWHGTPLKKMLNDVHTFEGRDSGYKDRVNQSIKNWDYLISPSPYASQCFRSAFDFNKDILEVGYPRNDIFYTQDHKYIEAQQHMIKQRLGIKDNRKIILYAPTFRDDEVNKAKKHTIDLQLDLHKMKDALGDEYILLLRPHIIISNALQLDDTLADFVIDTSKYHEISDLFLITDICITDYSSVMFDFANTKRPLLFFTYDLEHYKNDLRGFYFDFEAEAPGPLLKHNDDLIQAIQNIDTINTQYQSKYEQFYKRFCTFETGTAAQRIVNQFFKS
ncbi:CDP-glycerol glycerophosphotransferase family protein [Staphylococcus canis]|uniref:CDP-glycerol--glycerophosphate glycerophosphotransferase n=1 Tax=Staphylococcus canis TaxID=2724942 RepID=A0ABS0T9K7_9STAP|nr:CDP-glycerol glycerophosphotransferase family protein [Staphylococcus canis]MBI5974449.1 CDP-glycerol--glycerophosphate glycerophosphotransferase [Staphylococcus canis]